MTKLRLAIALLFLSTVPVLAQSPDAFLQTELEIHEHDVRLSELAEKMENWLSGRVSEADFSLFVKQTRDGLKPYQRLEKSRANTVFSEEKALVAEIQSFAGRKAPDFDGQKKLFLSLSRLTESRTTALIDWRRQQLKKMLGGKLTEKHQTYYRWELAWTDIWLREAELTRQLEQGFLDGSGPTAQELVKALLKLRTQADKIGCPDSMRNLDTTCKERLTLLTRTAEQLMRLKKRQSSGALTRVRRLSRQLSSLTEKFQAQRLEKLKSLK